MAGPVDPTAPLSPEGSAHAAGPPPAGRARRWLVGIALAALGLGIVIGVGVVLAVSGDDDDATVPVATTTSLPSTTTTVPPTAAPAPETTAGPTTAPATVAPPTSTTIALAVPVPPVIARFEVTPTDIHCVPGEAVPVTIVWAAEHATEVEIELLGIASDPEPASGSAHTALHCLPGEVPTSFVVTLTATGPGGTTSQAVTMHVSIT